VKKARNFSAKFHKFGSTHNREIERIGALL